MKGKTLPRILAWSYSRLDTYRQCPFRAKLKFIDKMKEPEGPALAHGSEVHKTAEDYLTGKVKRLPALLKSFSAEAKLIKNNLVGVETQWAFRQDWKACEWFAKDTWLRIQCDAVSRLDPKVLCIDDWKTGRIYPEKQDQLNLYGLGGLLLFPEVEVVKTRFIYIDQNEIKDDEVTRAELPAIKKHWVKETKAMLLDTTFAPRPNDKCRWCHFRKSNNGPCKF